MFAISEADAAANRAAFELARGLRGGRKPCPLNYERSDSAIKCRIARG